VIVSIKEVDVLARRDIAFRVLKKDFEQPGRA
jgi:hypothetical protein